MDIEEKFQEILQKYHYSGMPEDFRRNTYREIRKILRDACAVDKIVALKCAGVHTAHLFNDFADVLRLDFILDHTPDMVRDRIKQRQIPIVSTLQNRKVDRVIISSFEFREECVQELQSELRNGVEIVDIYEQLKAKGYTLTKGYYKYFEEPYKRIIEYQQQYRTESRGHEKGVILSELIGCYLDIRDILSALKGIREYVDQKFQGWEEKASLQENLNELISTIKRACRSRKQRDILWFWQDALPYEYSKEMTKFRSAAEKGMLFEEAYTSSWVTRSVYARTFDQQEEYDVFCDPNNCPKTHKTIEFMREAGYDCQKITPIGQKNIALDTLDIHHEYVLLQPCTSPELWWEGVRTLLSSDKQLFILLHAGVETHAPLYSPALEPSEATPITLDMYHEICCEEGRLRYHQRRVKNSMYIDKEFAFFLELLGENSIKIFMSDHGHFLSKDTRAYSKDATHVVMAVIGKDVPVQRYDRLFPLINFLNMLKFVLSPNETNETAMFTDEIWLNVVDIYEEGRIRKYINFGLADLGVACCGILTLKDRYVKLATGEELYHVFPDECTNYINEAKYQKRIFKLREHAGNRFVNIQDNPKFRYSYLLYDALGKRHIGADIQ